MRPSPLHPEFEPGTSGLLYMYIILDNWQASLVAQSATTQSLNLVVGSNPAEK